MAVLLSLLSAAVYGVGDFCGGMATKGASAAAVLLWSHGVGLLLIVAVMPFMSGTATTSDLVLGALGGLAGAAGVGLLYQALAIGPMIVVAPVAALIAAAIPASVGLVTCDRPGPAVGVGMTLALVAIVAVCAGGDRTLAPSLRRGVSGAIGAGVGFGLFFVALAATGDNAGLWPLLAARMASVSVMVLLALSGRIDPEIRRGPSRPLTASAGGLDLVANACYLLALRQGLLSVVAVLSSLYPVSTIVLARVVLGERFMAIQRVGIVLALAATALMATGGGI